MNTLRDRRPALVLVALLLASLAAAAAKRPLTHNDYDGWRSIQGQQLAPDGKHLAYALFPQDGDGELVVRNLATGQERREKVGARPAPPPPDPLNPEQRPEARGITISFTADSHTLVFSTFPSKAEKAKAGEEPKGGMVVMNLESGSVARVASVKNFQVPETGNGFIA